jgi:hypothetical protein
MRKALIVLATAAAVGVTVAATALSANGPGAAKMKAGQAVTFAGLTCTAYKGTTATNANIVCVRNNLRGYGVVISQDSVIVAKRVHGKVLVLFKKPNR